jgi:hypothetical protein
MAIREEGNARPSRGTALPTGEDALQERMQGRVVDGFRHKPGRLGGLDPLASGRIGIGTHVDDGDRRRGLNVPRGVNAVHRPLQLDVHEHDLRVTGEDVFNRLRATSGQRHDLIPEAAELPGDMQCRNGFILDNDHAGWRVHRATFGGVRLSCRIIAGTSPSRSPSVWCRALFGNLMRGNFCTLKDICRASPDLSYEYAEARRYQLYDTHEQP